MGLIFPSFTIIGNNATFTCSNYGNGIFESVEWLVNNSRYNGAGVTFNSTSEIGMLEFTNVTLNHDMYNIACEATYTDGPNRVSCRNVTLRVQG